MGCINQFIVNYALWCYYLVGGAITILKNDGPRQWEGLSHIWKRKNVWKHQPAMVYDATKVDTIVLLGLCLSYLLKPLPIRSGMPKLSGLAES